MKITSLFRKNETGQQQQQHQQHQQHQHHPWQKWPSCKQQPKTLSFRDKDNIYKSVNSVFLDPVDGVETPESWFTNSPETTSFSAESDQCFDGESLEVVVRGARSERLFFEPDDTSSILEEAKPVGFLFKESVILAMESDDPYADFKRSMEEMVKSYEVKDWKGLEELLGLYLRVNGKKNHGVIVGAFVDLVVEIAGASSSSCSESTSFSSAVSSFPPSPLCSVEGHDEIDAAEKMVAS